MNLPHPRQRTPFEKELLHRKARMYVVWALVTVVCAVVSLNIFDAQFFETVDPQLRRAYVKINKLAPSFASSEQSLERTYELFVRSRQEAEESGISMSQDYTPDDTSLGNLEGKFTLDWLTQLSVGNRGSVILVDKDSGEIVAHPDASMVGKTLMVAPLNVSNPVGLNVSKYKGFSEVELSKFSSEAAAADIKLKHMLVYPGDGTPGSVFSFPAGMQYGSIVTYEDTYIICGIDVWEYLSYMARAVYIVLIVSVLIWLVVHYIALVLDRHEEEASALRTRLTAITVIMTCVIFVVSWYIQILGDITSSLNSMQSYAKIGVANFENYENTKKRIDDWLDEQYLTQCRIARDYVNSEGVANVTRQDLDRLAENLGVMHIYVYDEEGKVVVTNSPYDHFVLSEDPEMSSYAFRTLLDGADHVIQPPRPDEVAGVNTQFIAVSRRNDQDLVDGFVEVAIDPKLREHLTEHLTVDSVLADLTVGIPRIALAFDNETLTVAAATNPAFLGQPIEDFGYTEQKLRENSSGFFYYGYETYCVGFAESDQYIIVPVSQYPGDAAASKFSLLISVIALGGLAAIMVLALYKYQENVVEAAPEEAVDAGGQEQKTSLTRQAIDLMGISTVVQDRKKAGFEDRWDMIDVDQEKTPERQTFLLACRLLLVFCLLHLVPLLYGSLFQDTEGYQFSGLSYVISGDWEKGVNIFAFTSCLILLFALYVFMMIANRILYAIAKVSDLRTETVCLLLRSSLSYFCVVAFIYYGLSQFGIPTQALLASVGIITLAVSVGAKDLVNDIIAGFFILLEGDLKVGDFVTVGGWNGTVQEIGLRTTKIFNSKMIKICNNSSLRDVISCQNPVILRVDVPVSLDVDFDELEAVLNEELPHMMDDVSSVVEGPIFEGVFEFTATQAVLTIRLDVASNRQKFIRRLFNNRISQVLHRRGIRRTPSGDLSVNIKNLNDVKETEEAEEIEETKALMEISDGQA